MNRREVLAGVGTVVAASTAGCLGVITGEEPAEFEATPAGVEGAVLEETGYESAGVEEEVIERELEAAGQSREVVVTNYQARYEKTIDMGPLGEQRGAVFTALTTPQVDVLGREFNPVADMSTEELAQQVQQQYEGLQDIEHQEDGEVSIQGSTAVRSTFTASATFAGEPVDIYLLLTEAVELGEDFVVTVGAYPQQGPDEEQNVLALMEAVQQRE
jgi:hypothetical protein